MGNTQATDTPEPAEQLPTSPVAKKLNVMQPPTSPDPAGFSLGMLRSHTFDERGLASYSSLGGNFQLGLTRAATISATVDSGFAATPRYNHMNQVLFRKHFNLKPISKRPSLEGLGIFMEQPIEPPTAKESQGVVIVVDPMSTGAVVAHNCISRGYQVINVISFRDCEGLLDMVPDDIEITFLSTLVYDDSNPDSELALNQLIEQIKGHTTAPLACIAGAETGVKLSDRLSEALSLRTNGSAGSEPRRNKFLMGETVRQAGVRAVKQRVVTTWPQVVEFIEEWKPEPFEVIVKPVESAGSDNVTLCKSLDEIQQAFGTIMGNRNGLGQINEAVLLQEYLTGIEYVVDHVSCDGVHKCIGLWEYDRQPTNDAGFVLHGQRFMTAEEPFAKELMEYVGQVLEALGIKEGPSHAEVKIHQGEPCLVEIGSRCHGAEGFWTTVADRCVGYNQVGATVDAYLDQAAFNMKPDAPGPRVGYGHIKFLLSYREGKNLRYNPEAIAEIKSMPSYLAMNQFKKDGDSVERTIDCFTWLGCVRLAHGDEAVVLRDYARLHELEQTTLFEVDAPAKKTELTPACVVVDPFSTGANVASSICSRGLACICVYSTKLEDMGGLENFVPQGVTVEFAEIVAPSNSDPEQAANDAVEALKALQQKYDIKAVVCGCESGVGLTDRVSERMGFRTNGATGTEARRNKYLMGEKVREAGVRAVLQRQCSSWAEVVDFLESSGLEDTSAGSYSVIVKPMDSAGSDGVTLCKSRGEVEAAFNSLFNRKNRLNQLNSQVLIQEYLEGEEYVVDSVSVDGVVKTVALWHYDKRPLHGQFNVYFGQHTITSSEHPGMECAKYIHQVLPALGIVNGPSHAEVKMSKGSPCLVEIGSRPHGAEGAWIPVANTTYGYNQVDATLDAYLTPEKFAEYSDFPEKRVGSGMLGFLLSHRKGKLVSINDKYLEEIRGMRSFDFMEIFVKPGDMLEPTKDCFSFIGNVRLLHGDNGVVMADYNRIHEIHQASDFVELE